MKKKVDPLGGVLLKEGFLDKDQLTDVLDFQAQPMPFASVCHILGHASEEQLVKALCRQHGVPGVVLGRSIINLECLDSVPKELAFKRMILPVYQDDTHLFMAVHDPQTREFFEELQFITGKSVFPHVAVHVCLARTLRLCYAQHERGETYWFGDQTHPSELTQADGLLAVISDVDDIPEEIASDGAEVKARLSGEVVSLDVDDLLEVRNANSLKQERVAIDDVAGSGDALSGEMKGRTKPVRVLVADSDGSARTALSRVLRSGGYDVIEAADGQSAASIVRTEIPSVVVLQVMLPGIPGFRLCQEIKGSGRYENVMCVLVGGSASHAAEADSIRERYRSDAFLPRNVGPGSALRTVEELMEAGRMLPSALSRKDGPTAEEALAFYREGKIEEALDLANKCVRWDPLSPLFRFIVANILHGQDKLYEAMDAYQVTVDLQPDWFPALSRLAYLQYAKGFVSRAIATWRKAIDVCPDPKVGQNIAAFITNLAKAMEERRR